MTEVDHSMVRPAAPYAYHAFISYSHPQEAVAAALQRDVRRFGVPWYSHRTASLVGPPGTRRPLRIFRYVTDLSAAPALWPRIVAALNRSQWFVLVASPAAARSPWVRLEIEWWRAHRPSDRILIALAEGQIVWGGRDFDWAATDAIPPALAGAFAEQPAWVDLRPSRSTPHGRQRSHLGDIAADFAAPIRGVDKDSLVGEQLRQRRRTGWTIRSVVALLTALVLATTVAAVMALRQRAVALDQRDTAVANELVAEADTVRDSQPGLARQLLAAARDIKLTPTVAGALANGRTIAQELHIDADTFAYRSDGRVLAVLRSGTTGSTSAAGTVPARNGRLSFYDPATLTAFHSQTLGQLAATAIAWGPAPGHLLALAYGRDVRLWDVSDPRAPVERGLLVGHTDTVLAVAISADGRTIASAGRDGEIRLWDATDPDRPALLSRIPLALRTARYTMQFEPDGHTLAVAPIPLRQTNPPVAEGIEAAVSEGPTLAILFDVTDPRRWTVSTSLAGKLDTFAFAPDGGRMVTLGPDGVRRWQVDPAGKASQADPLPVPDPAVTLRRVAYGQGGRIAAIADDGAVLLWEHGSGGPAALVAQLGIPRWDSVNPQALAFSPDGTRLALLTPGANAGANGSGVGAGTLRIWNVFDGRQRGALGSVPGQPVLSPDGRLLAAIDGTTIRLWDVSDPTRARPRGQWTGADQADGVAFSPSGRTLAAYGNGAVWALDVTAPDRPTLIGRWRPEDRKHLCAAYAGLPCEIAPTALAFPDEHTIAAGDLTGQVSLFDLRTPGHSPIAVLSRAHGALAALGMLPASDHPVLLAAALDGGTELWDLSDPAAAHYLGELPGGSYQVQDLATSRDGAVLAIARRDGTAWIWQVRDHGRTLHPLAVLSDTGDVNAVAVSPDGSRLVTIGRDSTLRGYQLDGDSASLAIVLHLGTTAGTRLGFVNDNHTLAIGTAYGMVTFWDLDPDANARAICLGIGTPITASQWAREAPGLPFRPPCS